jgi:hypothetical protein
LWWIQRGFLTGDKRYTNVDWVLGSERDFAGQGGEVPWLEVDEYVIEAGGGLAFLESVSIAELAPLA